MIGSMLIGELKQETNFSFRNVEDFKTYLKALDVDYDSEDVLSSGWLYK